MSNNQLQDQLVTVGYLLNHGFRPYTENDEDNPCDIPFDSNEGALNLREIELHRQMFVVTFSSWDDTLEDSCHIGVYVQDNIGCGFIEIPFPWVYLTVDFFESVYYGIRGHKPKFTGPPSEETSYEIIQPKQLNQ